MARLPAIVDAEVRRALDERLPVVREEVAAHVAERSLRDHRVWGPAGRLTIAPTAHVNDALFNTESGTITVGEYAFFGHGVAVLTGTHDASETREARQRAVPAEGRDVVIGPGAWLGTRSLVLGPCRIGADAVVAAGAVVTRDVPDGGRVAGVRPAIWPDAPRADHRGHRAGRLLPRRAARRLRPRGRGDGARPERRRAQPRCGGGRRDARRAATSPTRPGSGASSPTSRPTSCSTSRRRRSSPRPGRTRRRRSPRSPARRRRCSRRPRAPACAWSWRPPARCSGTPGSRRSARRRRCARGRRTGWRSSPPIGSSAPTAGRGCTRRARSRSTTSPRAGPSGSCRAR